MRNSADRAQPPSDLLVQAVLDADADRCANQIVQLATITLLVDLGLVTSQQAIERIEALTPLLAHEHLADDIDERIQRVIAWLSSEPRTNPRRWQPTVIRGGQDGSGDEG
jgi:hypothetical protein